jgi:DNA-3-methyladenine glycosylase II
MFRLYPRPPFRLDLTVWALRRRAQNAIDAWDGRSYRRALVIHGRPVAVEATQVGPATAPRLDVTVEGQWLASSVESSATTALTRLLGLQIDLSSFYARAATDRILGPLAQRYRGLKPPRFPTLFECLLNAVPASNSHSPPG